jgi:DNA-directed RNA polymerase specialized sigma subunit
LWLEQTQRKDVVRLRIEMVEILRDKARTEAWLQGLTEDERCFLGMRFEKGYGFDYIAVKMHLSRATLFRMQDKVLEKMMENRKKSEMV